MATLDALKNALRHVATANSISGNPLSDEDSRAGFDILVGHLGWVSYRDFIISQLSYVLASRFSSLRSFSVLEIGPGPKSVLGSLPGALRGKIDRYAAIEPNKLFATELEQWLRPTPKTESPLPGLVHRPDIHRVPFSLPRKGGGKTILGDKSAKVNVVLFCHSLYGMKDKKENPQQAIGLLVEKREDGLLVVFHREGSLRLDGLVCHRAASFPTGAIQISDDDNTLDCFASFIAGFRIINEDASREIQAEWRAICRTLACREEGHPKKLSFSSPEIMLVFNKHANALPDLAKEVPLLESDRPVKSREALLHQPASIVRPTNVFQIQQCTRWALKHDVGLTVIGGGHSGHCLWPSVIAVDMSAFDEIHILWSKEGEETDSASHGPLVVVGAGCKSERIIRATMSAGLTVPLGSRPSVGAGLWLEGGIGHMARLYGLACDAIVGAVIVSVESSQVFYVGHVPIDNQPAGSVRPPNDHELLWAIKGVGTKFGIIVSVIFQSFATPTYVIRNWFLPMNGKHDAEATLSRFDSCIAGRLPQSCSADAYLYWDKDRVYLGITVFASSTSFFSPPESSIDTALREVLGEEDSCTQLDSIGLFEAEKYMFRLHGGHGGGKTSSFKRCVFLKNIGQVAHIPWKAIETPPTPLCYFHFLQGGGAIHDIEATATAFGCRDWEFACVITGV